MIKLNAGWPAAHKVSQHAFLIISFTQRWRRSWCWRDSEFGLSWNVNWICSCALTENPCSFCFFVNWCKLEQTQPSAVKWETWVEVELAAEKISPLTLIMLKLSSGCVFCILNFQMEGIALFNVLFFSEVLYQMLFAWYCVRATWMLWFELQLYACNFLYLLYFGA